METKICKECGEEKPLNEFGKHKRNKDGYNTRCKCCINLKQKIRYKNINLNNKLTQSSQSKICKECGSYKYINDFPIVKSNCDGVSNICKECSKIYMNNWKSKNNQKDYQKIYVQKNKEILKEKHKMYYENNKEVRNKKSVECKKIRRQNDDIYKLKHNVRSLISGSIKQNGYVKKSKTHDILGCSYDEFKIHLENQFDTWMNWNNYGKYNGEPNYGWDIDHIIPQSSAITEEDVIRLNHHSNLQPLCSYINRKIKRNNIDWGK